MPHFIAMLEFQNELSFEETQVHKLDPAQWLVLSPSERF